MSRPTSMPAPAVSPDETHRAAHRPADASRAVAGWYESSWELVSGLEVTEVLVPEPDALRRGVQPVWPLSARA